MAEVLFTNSPLLIKGSLFAIALSPEMTALAKNGHTVLTGHETQSVLTV